jgi:hypothetical protein
MYIFMLKTLVRERGSFNDVTLLDSELEFPKISVINNFKVYRKFEGFLVVKI